MTRAYWKLFAVCVIAVVIVDHFFAVLLANRALSTDGRDLGWLLSVNLWMPGSIGLRIANLFGYRYNVGHSDEMGPFVVMTSLIGCLVAGAALFGLVVLIRRVVRSWSPSAAA